MAEEFAQTRLQQVSESILEGATELRARYGFRSPDAILLATVIDAGAAAFLTGDARLARCGEIKVDVFSPTLP